MVQAFTIDQTSFPAAKVTSIGQLVSIALPIIMVGTGLIFLAILLKAAFDIMTSGDNPDALKKAYSTITSAIIGIFIVVASFLVIRLLGVVLKTNILP